MTIQAPLPAAMSSVLAPGLVQQQPEEMLSRRMAWPCGQHLPVERFRLIAAARLVQLQSLAGLAVVILGARRLRSRAGGGSGSGFGAMRRPPFESPVHDLVPRFMLVT